MTEPGGCWPTPDQTLLLRAALLDPERARPAWDAWRAANDITTANQASLRLLPLVYRNLGTAGIDDADVIQLKSTYRASWLRNQLIFRRAAEALRALAGAGIPTMLLKGAALTVAFYGDGGTRPMYDIDVFVPRHESFRAIEVLQDAGWQSDEGYINSTKPSVGHAHLLQHPEGYLLDLHRYAIADATGLDDSVWANALEVELMGERTLVPSATDQLLLVTVHGARWNPIPPIRWLADAVVIEREGGPIDWERFVAEAIRRQTTAAVVPALEHLVEAVEFPLPDGVLQRLRAAPRGLVERWVHRVSLHPGGGGTWLPVVLDAYLREARVDKSLRLTHFLRDVFGDGTPPQIAWRATRKAGEVALAQSIMRLAPKRVVVCESCGRRIAKLRGPRATICSRCAAAS